MASRNLLTLNGQALTDHGRTFNDHMDKREVANELANGTIKKYIKGGAYKDIFSVEWDWIPSLAANTFDIYAARDAIRTIAYLGTTMTLVVANSIGGTETYTVWVEDYTEDLLKRDFVGGDFHWNLKLELREQ
jgi:hypothetical protein